MRLSSLLVLFPALLSSSLLLADESTPSATYINDAILPPQQPWHGASEQLMLAPDAFDATPFEQSAGIASPDYSATFDWLDRLADSSAMLHKVSLGKSPQGRDIWMYVASSDGAETANELQKNHKPTVLVQAGIHAGEIDGKDAGMMLLRDMLRGDKQELLDEVNLLFVPIFNVDGHERSSEFNRVNQRGPKLMGWRTNSQNLNLNRDYSKADTSEMQAMLTAINAWDPQLYIDVHVTDGIDYQYDVTYGYNIENGFSPSIYRWFNQIYRPQIDQALEAAGHVPGGLVFALDNTDLNKGLEYWHAGPRFSDGYGDVRHLPTVLIENHSLKPFKRRVLGTYVLLEQTLKTVAAEHTKLQAAIEIDRFRYWPLVPLTWENERQAATRDFKGIGYSVEQSAISGDKVVRWNGEPTLYPNLIQEGPTKPAIEVTRPSNYYIPPQWQMVIERLKIQGVRMTPLASPRTLKLQQYQLADAEFTATTYEGRQRVKAAAKLVKLTTTLPVGTMEIPTDQPLGDLAMLLLEPESADSFLQWGFFNSIFSRTEYMEPYAVEPMAQQMLATQPELKAAFEQALKDPQFAKDSNARLRWFYERSPYYDNQYAKYPVYRSR
ncbi:M14 family metallopeptidase [Shewanella avicenniae]|uniref:M14 family metallopeptidase n=1 Tax=Shewanella avicenniae TaxID=2814294 RepID=A0ABX7QQW7_9GAMM|nr:M14 family metallopeptidase [Shewanella avicenniae]QSX33858.1 M14 family metallopeptidase [Shewanella avicenniae]